MTEERTTPLRERMIEDMRIRGMGDKTQKGHIRAIKHFAAFLGHPPDTATSDEVRAYQLHMTDTGVSTATFNTRIVSLRFFFGVPCGREEMKRYMQFRRKPRKLPVVLSVEEVGDLLAADPGPGLKYCAALGISYGAGLRASEVCNHKVAENRAAFRNGVFLRLDPQRRAGTWSSKHLPSGPAAQSNSSRGTELRVAHEGPTCIRSRRAFPIGPAQPPRLPPSEVCQRGPIPPCNTRRAAARIEKPSGKATLKSARSCWEIDAPRLTETIRTTHAIAPKTTFIRWESVYRKLLPD